MSEPKAPTTEESIQQSEYEVPLSPAYLLDLGRVTAILSQIDSMLSEALSSASKTPAWAAYIFAGKATMTAKIKMLESMLSSIPEEDAKKSGKKLVKSLHSVNNDRNILFHGMWVYQLNPKTERGSPACIWQNNPPIRPADLATIAARAAKVSRELGAFIGAVNPSFGHPPWTKPRRFFLTTENVEMEKLHGGALKKASV